MNPRTPIANRIKFNAEGEPLLPNHESAIIDLLYAAQQERYMLQHITARLEKIETACEDWLRDEINLKERQGGSGKIARIEIEPVRTPKMDDFLKFFAYARKVNDPSLLEQRFSKAAVKERWEHGKAVPGIGAITVKKIHIHKVKR